MLLVISAPNAAIHPSIVFEILGTFGKLPIAIILHICIKPSGPRSTWQGTYIGLVESNLLLGRYSNVRAVDELVAEARLVVMGWSAEVKKSFFHRHC